MSVSGKRSRLKSSVVGSEDEEPQAKKNKNDSYFVTAMGETPVNKSRIYNYGYRKKPAELFRKDLISCMKLPDSEQLNRDDYLLITDTWKEEWEKGVQVPVNPDCLPEPVANVLEKSKETNFKIPKKLIKSDPDADSYVSRYELDLLDVCWINSLKDSDEGISLSQDVVEEIINELEHDCAKNMKAKQIGIEYNDHIICDVCRSPDAEDGNEMVFCDSCNICVHQACYGITSIPEGEWLCRPCKELGSQANVSCVLCPNVGGAFKPTTSTSQWAHVSCALWIPEVSIGCVSSMEPITKIRQIPSSRWNLICSLCNIKAGAPIQCSVKSCKSSYHVTCAFNQKLKMKAIVEEDTNGVKLKSFCSKHSDSEESGEKSANSRELSKTQHEIEIATSLTADSETENEFWKYVDISQINHKFLPLLQEEYANASAQTLLMFLDLIYQYWKLKRCSNYGAPLIKVVTSASLEEMQMQQRTDILRLRVDLERIRNLSYMLCRREKIKRNWLRTHQQTVEKALSYSTGVTCAPNNNGSNHVFEAKLCHVSEDKLKLVNDVLNCNIIYDDDECDRNKPKQIIKQLTDLLRKDRFKKSRVNPYAKYYLPQGRRRSQDEDDTVIKHNSHHKHPQSTSNNGSFVKSSVHINGMAKSQPQPLSQKVLPSNGLNSASVKSCVNENHSHRSCTEHNQSRTLSSHKPSKEDSKDNATKLPAPILTRSSALMGYKIPKKKRDDNHTSKGADPPQKSVCDYSRLIQPGKHVFDSERRSPIGKHCDVSLQQLNKNSGEDSKFKNHFNLRHPSSRNFAAGDAPNGLNDEAALVASAANDVDMRKKDFY